MAEREIVFTLRVASSKDAEAEIAKFGKAAAKVQDDLDRTVVASAKRRAKAEADAAAMGLSVTEAADLKSIISREKAQAKAEEARQKAVIADERAAERALAAKEKALAKEEAARQKAVIAEQRAAEKEATAQEQATARAEQSRVRELQKSERAFAQANKAITTGNLRMLDEFSQVGEGVARMGRGFALLGIIGEEDQKKILDWVVKVQAGFDIFKGGIEIWRHLVAGVQAYRATVDAATAAQKALTAAQAAGGAPGVAAGRVGGVAGTAVVGALAALATAGAVKSSIDAWDNYKRFGFGGGARYGSWTDTIATKEVGVASWFSGLAGKDLVGNLAADKAARRREAAFGIAEESIAAEAQGRSAEEQLAALRRSKEMRSFEATLGNMPEPQRRVALAKKADDLDQLSIVGVASLREQAEARLATAMRNDTGDDQTHAEVMAAAQAVDELNAAMAAMHDRLATNLQERLEGEKAISAERLRAADEAISKTQDELTMRQEFIKAERERLMSAQERFGQMTPEQQQRLIGLKRRADAGEELSMPDMQELERGIGTRGVSEMAGAAYRTNALRHGWAEIAEPEERRLALDETVAQQLEVKLKDQRELRVTMERDDDKLAEKLAARIRDERDKRDEILIKKTLEIIRQSEDRQRNAAKDRGLAASQSRGR